MIAFKDFKKAPRLLGLSTGPLETAVEAANAWIAAEAVHVLNVETLTDTAGINVTTTSQDGIRVWYRAYEAE